MDVHTRTYTLASPHIIILNSPFVQEKWNKTKQSSICLWIKWHFQVNNAHTAWQMHPWELLSVINVEGCGFPTLCLLSVMPWIHCLAETGDQGYLKPSTKQTYMSPYTQPVACNIDVRCKALKLQSGICFSFKRQGSLFKRSLSVTLAMMDAYPSARLHKSNKTHSGNERRKKNTSTSIVSDSGLSYWP